MIRTQIQLPESEYEMLRTIASRERRSIADCIREGIRMFLGHARTKGKDVADVAGRFRPVPDDDLKDHDRWIAEAARKGPREGRER